jgi:hypothetical protein
MLLLRSRFGSTMNFVLQPWQLLLAILAGWSNRQQQEIIEYLRTENQVLKEKLGKRRIILSDDQRRRLARKGNVLGRKVLETIGTLFTPDTLLRWHRLLVAQKWDYSNRGQKKPGRPPVADAIRTLVVRMASENPTWGYDRIQGSLANLGYTISDATVGNILKEHGIEPAPDRKRQTTWQTFLQAHWDVLAAIDFTTIEVWTKNGLVTFYLLFVMELATRRVHFAGCTTGPDEGWMKQIARHLRRHARIAYAIFLFGGWQALRYSEGRATRRRVLSCRRSTSLAARSATGQSLQLFGVPSVSGPRLQNDGSLRPGLPMAPPAVRAFCRIAQLHHDRFCRASRAVHSATPSRTPAAA